MPVFLSQYFTIFFSALPCSVTASKASHKLMEPENREEAVKSTVKAENMPEELNKEPKRCIFFC